MSPELVLANVRLRMTPYEPQDEAHYVAMIEAFLDGRTSVDEFETTYLRTFKDDPTDWPEDLYQILNEVFLDLDAYYPDPLFWDEWTSGEEESRRRVARALEALRSTRMAAT